MNITIDTSRTDGNWVHGYIYSDVSKNEKLYDFEAKIFCEPSMFGIFNGRISKLRIVSNKNKTILNFDRGWDIGDDNAASEGIAKELIDFLENYAQSEEFIDYIERVKNIEPKITHENVTTLFCYEFDEHTGNITTEELPISHTTDKNIITAIPSNIFHTHRHSKAQLGMILSAKAFYLSPALDRFKEDLRSLIQGEIDHCTEKLKLLENNER